MRPGVSNRLQGLGMKAARIRAKRSSAQDVPGVRDPQGLP